MASHPDQHSPRRRKNLIVALVTALSLAFLAGLFAFAQVMDKDNTANAAGDTPDMNIAVPAGGASDGAGVEAYPGKAEKGAPVVDLYFDFQCPYCARLEEANGPTLNKMAQDGKIRLMYHPVAYLDGAVGGDNSMRTAEVAMFAADHNKLAEFIPNMFRLQRQEGEGYTEGDIMEALDKSGLGSMKADAKTIMANNKYRPYVARVEEHAAHNGVTSIPTLVVNGKPQTDSAIRARLYNEEGTVKQIIEDATK